MQIIFRPNHDRPPKKFKPPLEKVPTPAVKESTEELNIEETSKAKVGFVVEEEVLKEQGQEQFVEENEYDSKKHLAYEEDMGYLMQAENEAEFLEDKNSSLGYPQQGCHKPNPGCKPGHPYPEYPEYPKYPECPGWKPDHNCPGYPNPDPEDPKCKNDHVCKPYPYPGNYYPLQCLGYAYIPWQTYQRQFQPNEALQKGTLFPELYSPYFPERRPPVIPRPYCNMWQCPNMMRRKKR